ncbi:MAG: hypothetical protein GY880_11925 [Planctomycetaceae bacterium]|nr:hypothetical protein [Planctomycetaceae bacterium]MCP4477707.1 hypothetical protein [Planctomycetaceae bacterium]MCP4774938.1 hypothetical protein [Planctomycetaceae bacterium]
MFQQLALQSIFVRLIFLTVVELLAGVVAISVCWFLEINVFTGFLALGVCLVSTLAAHVASEYPRGHELLMARMAMQMAIRVSIPGLVAVWGIYLKDPPLDLSLVFYIIFFYFVGMIADVQVALKKLGPDGASED